MSSWRSTILAWKRLEPFPFGGLTSLPLRPPRDLNSIAIAYQWVGRIFTICIEMILPGVAGYWLDQYFGFEFSVLALIGFLLGLIFGMTHLVVMATALQQREGPEDRPPQPRQRRGTEPSPPGSSHSDLSRDVDEPPPSP